jgi:hypothetical protein
LAFVMEEQLHDHRNARHAKLTMPNVKAGVNVSWIELLINPAMATRSTTHKMGLCFYSTKLQSSSHPPMQST